MAAPQAPPWGGRSVQARQMALYAEEGADQAQARAEGEQAGHRQRRQRHQLEFGRIQAGKLGNRRIQRLQGQRHRTQRQRAGAQAQQGAV